MNITDRFELGQMGLSALRERALSLSIPGVEEMEKEALIEAIIARVVALSPASSSISWIHRRPSRVVEPVAEPKEPETIFIDRGLPVPDSYPGTRLRVLIRDPGILFVYWESAHASAMGWEVAAYDARGREICSFTSPEPLMGTGYLIVQVDRVKRVSLRPLSVEVDVALTTSLEKPAEAIPVIPPNRWVDIRDPHPVQPVPSFAARMLPGEAAQLEALGGPGASGGPGGAGQVGPGWPSSADAIPGHGPALPSSGSQSKPSSEALLRARRRIDF